MSDLGRPLVLALVGNRLFSRYAIVMNSGREAPMWYRTGRPEEPWSPDSRKATRWADPEVAAAVLGQLQPDADRGPEIGCGRFNRFTWSVTMLRRLMRTLLFMIPALGLFDIAGRLALDGRGAWWAFLASGLMAFGTAANYWVGDFPISADQGHRKPDPPDGLL